ncbi:MAG: hypothetical protein WC327_04005 [Candidatus Cloacimonadia bacterium]|jgi:tetratricopeptide (TPR) repeat protein
MKNDITSILWQARYESETNWLKAVQTLKDALMVYPEEMKLYDELGNLYFNRELFKEAAKQYEVMYSANPKDMEVVFKLAFCYLLDKNFERSLYYFDKISSDMPEAAYNKCIALHRLGRGFEAIFALEKLTEEFTYSVKPFILLAKLYLEYERYDKVITLVEKTESLFGPIPELTFIRGTVYFNTGQWMKTYIDYKNSEQVVRSNPLYYRMYSLTCERIGLTQKAVSLLQSCIKDFPFFYGAYYDLIKIYLIHGRHDESMKIVDKLFKKGITLSEIENTESQLFYSVLNSL